MGSNTPASSPPFYALLSEHLKMAQDPPTSPNLAKNPPAYPQKTVPVLEKTTIFPGGERLYQRQNLMHPYHLQ